MLHQVVHVETVEFAGYEQEHFLVSHLDSDVVAVLEHSYLLSQPLGVVLVQQNQSQDVGLQVGRRVFEDEPSLGVE